MLYSFLIVIIKGASNSVRPDKRRWSIYRIREHARVRLLTPSCALFDPPLHPAASSFPSLSITPADLISCSLLILHSLSMCFCSRWCWLSALLSGEKNLLDCFFLCNLFVLIWYSCFFIYYICSPVACILEYVCSIDTITCKHSCTSHSIQTMSIWHFTFYLHCAFFTRKLWIFVRLFKVIYPSQNYIWEFPPTC